MEHQSARAYTPPESRPVTQRSGLPLRPRSAYKKARESAEVAELKDTSETERIPVVEPSPVSAEPPVSTELIELQERLKKTEQALQQQRQSESAEQRIAEMVAGMTSELTAVTRQQALELRKSHRAALCWKISGAVAGVLFFACVALYLAAPFFLKQTVPPAPTASPSAPHAVALPHPPVPDPADREAERPAPTPEETPASQALNRLERVLDRVPPAQVDDVMRAANQWLIASGGVPCTVQPARGDNSLLVTLDHRGLAPLGAALSHCADAVEHVVE